MVGLGSALSDGGAIDASDLVRVSNESRTKMRLANVLLKHLDTPQASTGHLIDDASGTTSVCALWELGLASFQTILTG